MHIGGRRTDGWWEPTFAPALEGTLSLRSWDFASTTGPKNVFLSGDQIAEGASDGKILRFQNLTFENCDIQGVFDHRPSIVFHECRFHGCDFGFSEWVRVTFRRCEFKKCSLALTTFEECEFRDCEWEEIGLQGSKTDFIRTFITNPTEFINAGFSGLKPGREQDKEHVSNQAYRLEGTKAQVARTILASHKEVGDDDTFYESARLHDLQQAKAKLRRDWHRLWFGKGVCGKLRGLSIIPHLLETCILCILGIANDWGATLLRPVMALCLTFIAFALVYRFVPILGAGDNYLQKSFDITTLAGYGNQVAKDQSIPLRIVEGAQLLISILLYTTFFSTAVTRNSRAR